MGYSMELHDAFVPPNKISPNYYGYFCAKLESLSLPKVQSPASYAAQWEPHATRYPVDDADMLRCDYA